MMAQEGFEKDLVDIARIVGLLEEERVVVERRWGLLCGLQDAG